MENRAQQHHRERLGEALREEIVALVEGELGDPRIGLVSVTEVHLAPDGKTARVFIAASGTDEEAQESLEGLNAARGYIRHEVTRRLARRQSPEIFFVLDRSEEHGVRIDELLQRIEAPGLGEWLARDPSFLSQPVRQNAAVIFIDLSAPG